MPLIPLNHADFLQGGRPEGARPGSLRVNSLADSAAPPYESLRKQLPPVARRIIRAVREQSQIEAMREALRGDRERAEARRKAGRPRVPRVPTTGQHHPPAGQLDPPAVPPGPTDTRQ
jgi:hypothetical protein